jgi:hypothetical protein
MEIEVFKHEQYGPTIISHGRNKKGEVKTIQHIGLPMTEDGIASAIRAKFDEPEFVNPPVDPKAPKMEEPVEIAKSIPIAKEILDEVKARVAVLNATPLAKRKFTYADMVTIAVEAEPIKEL